MCEQVYSESGALTYIRGCKEFNLIVSDRDRLAGVVAGLEEQNARNLDALRRAEAECAKLNKECEAWVATFDAGRAREKELRRENASLQDQINTFNAERLRVGKENAKLREALMAVEWKGSDERGRKGFCPCCGNHQAISGHAPSCIVGNALKEVG